MDRQGGALWEMLISAISVMGCGQDGRMCGWVVGERDDVERDVAGHAECWVRTRHAGSPSSANCTVCVTGTYSTASGDVL